MDSCYITLYLSDRERFFLGARIKAQKVQLNFYCQGTFLESASFFLFAGMIDVVLILRNCWLLLSLNVRAKKVICKLSWLYSFNNQWFCYFFRQRVLFRLNYPD